MSLCEQNGALWQVGLNSLWQMQSSGTSSSAVEVVYCREDGNCSRRPVYRYDYNESGQIQDVVLVECVVLDLACIRGRQICALCFVIVLRNCWERRSVQVFHAGRYLMVATSVMR